LGKQKNRQSPRVGILLKTPNTRKTIIEECKKLKSEDIFSRRYFYPLISEFPMYKNIASSDPLNLPIATKIANEVLCLPIYPGLSEESISKIIDLINKAAI
jgi:dTDP-4-amino-4,6-dideoxygalactose transaminase